MSCFCSLPPQPSDSAACWLPLCRITGCSGLLSQSLGCPLRTSLSRRICFVQLSTEPVMRGRVISILLAMFLGGTPIGAPIVGWIAGSFGPRWALGFGATSGFAATIVGIYYLSQYRHLQTHIDAGRFVKGQPDLESYHRSTIEQKIT